MNMFLSTKKLWIGMALVASLGYSCQHEDGLSVEAITGFKVALVDEPSVTETRSTPQELGKPTVDKFKLKIANSATGKSIYDAGYTKDIIKASAGVYDVTASFGDNAVLAYDAPYYEGKKEDIAIEEGDTASVTVECAVANALASVTFEDSDKFKELYSSYAVEVAVENSSLKLGDGDKRSAYYRADSKPTFTFKGVLKANGKSVEALLEDKTLSDPATFAAKAHCRLTLALKEMVPGIIPTIVKTEVDTVTVSETLPMEWLPAPKVSATGFSENRTLDVYETAPTEASIDFTLSSPLQDMDFSVNFADENLQSLNGDYTLSALTNEQRLDFVNAGIDIPIIGEDKPSVRFSNTLTGALLATNEGVVNNTFTLKSVKANDRTNADGALTYTIATHKPEFTVSVLPGNIWTKEFTLGEITVEEGKGNLEEIKKSLVYQYQENGEWKDCNNQDSRQQVFAEHPSNRNYKVRALYRGALASNEVDVEMEEPKALPNGNMDEWTESTRDVKYLWTTYKQPFFEPWNDSTEQWWNTNSIQTMPTSFDIINSVNFASFPTVTYLISGDNNQEKSAVIRTINFGKSNSSIAAVGDNTRGILYAGTTSSDGTLSEGRPWSSRPTQLTFNYKYSSYNNERFGVYVELYADGNSSPIAIGTFESINGESKTEFTPYTIKLEYSNLELKPSIIKIKFCSVAINDDPAVQKNVSVNVPEGSDKYYNVHGGSVLTIDDISLVYDK